jgi:hypothetical protein
VSPSALVAPRLDPAPLFELFRGNFATELLTAAVSHFQVFGYFARGPLAFEELRKELGLAERSAVVLVTALRAFGLLVDDGSGKLDLSELAREHLVPDSPFDVSDYIALGADSPGVAAMVEHLRNNRPAGLVSEEPGLAFVYREGLESAMEKEAAARYLTLALAGRARNVAPVLAARVPLDRTRLLLDVGGGTGVYSIAFLQKNPGLRAVVWDRPEVLKVAAEMGRAYGVADRLQCVPGDMFKDPAPAGADTVLLSNVLHDWDVPECKTLIGRCAAALSAGGRLLIHDVFLNDTLDGPLSIALYSAALFCVTEGRAYSAAEYRGWMTAAGLVPGEITPTLIHCGVLPAVKAS